MSVLSRVTTALSAVYLPKAQRDVSLSYMLGNQSRIAQSSNGLVLPNMDQAWRNSVWWACLVLRANVMSNFGIAAVKPDAAGFVHPVANPGPMFDQPWPGVELNEFIFGMEMDKARYGNAVGIIRARDAFGYATQVEPVAMGAGCSAVMDGMKIKQWRVGKKYYDPEDIWHERAYTLNGWDLGLAPLAYAAYTMGLYNSAQKFALDWFALGANPRGVLQHTKRDMIPDDVRDDAKAGFKSATANGDIFITGNSWDWKPSIGESMSPNFLAQQAESNRDVCRYMGVPASMVDVEISTGNITYANVTQANLQWLITSIGPSVNRTEKYWTRHAASRTRQACMDTDNLMRMDPVTRADMLIRQTNALLRVPSEVRAADNLPPYTPEQMDELEIIARLRKPPPFGTPTDPTDPIKSPAPAPAPVEEPAP